MDGKYVQIKNRKTANNVEVECQLWSDNKTVCAAINRTSNLFCHIKQSHPTEIDAFYVYVGQTKSTIGDEKIQTKLTDVSCSSEKVNQFFFTAHVFG